MAWTDVVGGIGQGIESGFGAYKWLQDLALQREKMQQDEELTKQRLATNLMVQGMKFDQALEVAGLKNLSAEKIAEIRANASRYGADQRLAGTEYTADRRLEGVQDTNRVRGEGQLYNFTLGSRGLDLRKYGIDTTAATTRRGQDIGLQRTRETNQSGDWRAGINFDRDIYNDTLDATRPGGVAQPSPFGAASLPLPLPPPPTRAPAPSGVAAPAPVAPPPARPPAAAASTPAARPAPPVQGRPAPTAAPAAAAPPAAPVNPALIARQVQALMAEARQAAARGDWATVDRVKAEVAKLRATASR